MRILPALRDMLLHVIEMMSKCISVCACACVRVQCLKNMIKDCPDKVDFDQTIYIMFKSV